jgi:uncharacterized membrane protein
MELDTLFGLPAHPLMVHIPVVLIPLAGIIAIVFAFKPVWLDRYGWGLVALSGIGALGGILAAGSGESLADSRRASAALNDHAEMGEAARNLGLLFFLVVLGVVLVRHFARKKAADAGFWKFAASKTAAIIMSVALVLSAAGATAIISVAGHQGAKLVWNENERGGDQGGGGDNDGG